MDSREFVKALKIAVTKSTSNGLIRSLENPPGRKPPVSLIKMSEWYNSQDDQTKSMIRSIIANAVDMAVFNFLSVLDGVIAVENESPKGKMELWYIGQRKQQLNAEDQPMLHDLYNTEDD